MIITFLEVNDLHPVTFKLHRENGCQDYLFVHFKSPTMIMIDGTYVETGKNHCIFFDKHKIQSYFPKAPDQFLHDYMHFDLETEYEQLLFSEIPKGQLIQLSLPELISSSLANIKKEQIENFSKYKSEILNHLGMVFLYRIKNELDLEENNKGKTSLFRDFYQLRLAIYRNPQKEWSVEEMCKEVRLSRSYFQHLYKEFFSVSCIQDLINARIETAKTLLINNHYRIHEIADKCGYRNITHFNRQFREIVGLSPEEFRKKQ